MPAPDSVEKRKKIKDKKLTKKRIKENI